MGRISIKKGVARSKINVAKRGIGGKMGAGADDEFPDCPCMLDDTCPADCGSICDPDVPNKVGKVSLVSNPVSKLKIGSRKRVIR